MGRKTHLTGLLALIYPPTKAKLHALVTWVGVAFAAVAVVITWAGTLGLTTSEKIGATVGMLTTLAAGWKRARPKIDAGIDALPIPTGTTVEIVEDKTPVIERKPDGGHIRLVALALIGLGFGLALLLMPRVVRAAESQFGGCFAGGSICAGPSATITVGEFNLATSKFSGGISPGLGYGLTYATDQWYATGLAGYLSFEVGGGNANHARPALMLSFANYVRVGVGVDVTEQAVGTLSQWSVLFGLGSDFGGTPSYVRGAR